MRFATLSRGGIDRIVDETLEALPIEERFRRVFRTKEFVPYNTKVLPNAISYALDDGAKRIDIVGPYESVPNSLIASTKEEKRKLDEEQKDHYAFFRQGQIIVLGDSVTLRDLYGLGSSKGIRALNLGCVYLGGTHTTVSLWEHAVEDMAWHFLVYNRDQHIENSKAIFETERGRDKLAETFEKFGLKRIEVAPNHSSTSVGAA